MPETVKLDIAAARDLWNRLAPPPSRRLIDAESEDIGKEKRKRCSTEGQRDGDDRDFCALLALLYFWDASRLRYRNGSGQLVSVQAVKQSVNTFAVKVQNQLGAITSRLIDRSIGMPEYAAAMTQKITAAHTASYAVGRGGVKALTGNALADAERAIGFHVDKFDGFARDIGHGGVSPEATVARARLYGSSVSTTYETAHQDGLRLLADSGVKIEVRNILGEAEHCSSKGFTTGCQDETDRGWVEFGTMSLPGQRTCGPNCKCRLDHRIVQR